MSGRSFITTERLKAKIEEMADGLDLERTGFQQFLGELAHSFGGSIDDILPHKVFVRDCLLYTIQERQFSSMGGNPTSSYNNHHNNNNSSAAAGAVGAAAPTTSNYNSMSNNDVDDYYLRNAPPPLPSKKMAGATKASAAAAAATSGSTTTTTKTASGEKKGQKPISPGLASLFQVAPDVPMARTEVLKRLWEYIRNNNLQNPKSKREILLDGPMQSVFGCTTFDIFTIHKYVSAHISPFRPVDLNTCSIHSIKKRKRKQNAAESKNSGGGGDEDTAEPGSKKTKSGNTITPGLQPPWRLSPELQVIMGGVEAMPRPQVVSKLWEYIRSNQLQNPKDKREIWCDAALAKVMGGQAKVTMFSMNQYLSSHLLEKIGGKQPRKKKATPTSSATAAAAATTTTTTAESEDLDDSDPGSNHLLAHATKPAPAVSNPNNLSNLDNDSFNSSNFGQATNSAASATSFMSMSGLNHHHHMNSTNNHHMNNNNNLMMNPNFNGMGLSAAAATTMPSNPHHHHHHHQGGGGGGSHSLFSAQAAAAALGFPPPPGGSSGQSSSSNFPFGQFPHSF